MCFKFYNNKKEHLYPKCSILRSIRREKEKDRQLVYSTKCNKIENGKQFAKAVAYYSNCPLRAYFCLLHGMSQRPNMNAAFKLRRGYVYRRGYLMAS